MPSSALDRAIEDVKIVSSILKELPDEINGGIVAALIVNILFRYGMEEEWIKIVDAVDETMADIDRASVTDTSEVLMN